MRKTCENQGLHISRDCTKCGACVKNCAFLEERGTPKSIAETVLSGSLSSGIAFDCSLCGLCETICPEKLPITAYFLEMRRQCQQDGSVDMRPYRPILQYEKTGHSRLFAHYDIPEGCDTVFFPGCTFPGTRPKTTQAFFKALQKHVPTAGIVLDCCHKPSHDLGRQDYFESRFARILQKLREHDVKRVIVACPNCYKVFREYGQKLEIIQSAYEFLAEKKIPDMAAPDVLDVVLHDPCPLRNESGIHKAVRSLATSLGCGWEEARNNKRRTLCCGEGGSVPFVRPDLALRWSRRRVDQAGGKTILTYCAGCTVTLSRLVPTVHILDMHFFRDSVLSGTFKPLRGLTTYLARLWLKLRLLIRRA